MNFLKKVLIVYTNSGSGHRRAAEALFKACAEILPGVSVEIVDSLDYATPVFKRTYPKTYLLMVNYCPTLWGLMYKFSDLPTIDRIARLFRRMTNAHHGKRFEKLVLEQRPDLVLTTHWLPNEIISHLKKKGKIETILATCITDFYPHSFWRDEGVDLYITPAFDLTARLVELGVSQNKIIPLGIPIDPVFKENYDRAELRQKLKLNGERFSILIASGGFGVGPVEELVEEMLKIIQPLQIIAVCGNNPKLQTRLQRFKSGTIHEVQVYGFVNNMHELMSAADIIITKSGGLTTTEAMAKCLPMVILFPIPGQEMSNCEFVVRHKAGIKAQDIGEARNFVEEILNQPQDLARMKANLQRLGKPDSAQNILRYLLERFKV